jgi:hypothetical protein
MNELKNGILSYGTAMAGGLTAYFQWSVINCFLNVMVEIVYAWWNFIYMIEALCDAEVH